MKKVGKRTINKLLKEHFIHGIELADRVEDVWNTPDRYELKITTKVDSGIAPKPSSLQSGVIVWVNCYPSFAYIGIRK